MTARMVAAWTIPATGLRPPARTLAAVRASAPVAGRPPKAADAMLAMPWAAEYVQQHHVDVLPRKQGSCKKHFRMVDCAIGEAVSAAAVGLCTAIPL
jgi:hypothetical protein